MEKFKFNTKGFEAGDFVKVIYNDKKEEIIQLAQGTIYIGAPERKCYPDGEIIPATPPAIVVMSPEHPEGRGIPIDDVEDVILVKKMN